MITLRSSCSSLPFGKKHVRTSNDTTCKSRTCKGMARRSRNRDPPHLSWSSHALINMANGGSAPIFARHSMPFGQPATYTSNTCLNFSELNEMFFVCGKRERWVIVECINSVRWCGFGRRYYGREDNRWGGMTIWPCFSHQAGRGTSNQHRTVTPSSPRHSSRIRIPQDLMSAARMFRGDDVS